MRHGPVDSVSKTLTLALGGHTAPLMTKKLEFDNKTNEKEWLRTKPWAGSNVESLSPNTNQLRKAILICNACVYSCTRLS